jgi:proline racemase
VGETTADSFDATIPSVTGMAYQYGSSQFTVDPRDPLVPGFVLWKQSVKDLSVLPLMTSSGL